MFDLRTMCVHFRTECDEMCAKCTCECAEHNGSQGECSDEGCRCKQFWCVCLRDKFPHTYERGSCFN